MGLTIEQWWELTPREARKHFNAYERRIQSQVQIMDTTNHVLGRYIGIAVNNPKHYPSSPMSERSYEQVLRLDGGDSEMDDIDEAKINALFGNLARTATKTQPAPEKPAESEISGNNNEL